MIDKNTVFQIEKFLRNKKVLDDSFGGLKMQQRKDGKTFTFEEHLRALIYAQMSAQTVWAHIEQHFDQIDEIFFHYDISQINLRDGEYFVDKITSISCGSRLTHSQMAALHKNIAVMQKIVHDYGSMDIFVTSAPAPEIVLLLSDADSRYKLAQVGPALAWEYLRNVGIDGAKPDLHMKRILGRNRLACSKNEATSDEEVYQTVKKLSEETGYFMAQIDYIFWCFCASGKGEVCTADPHCSICPVKKDCRHRSKAVSAEARESSEKPIEQMPLADSPSVQAHTPIRRMTGGIYRDQYYDAFLDYLKARTAQDAAQNGNCPCSDSKLKTMATDTFFLEKHDGRDFGYWFTNDQTMQEAGLCLAENLKTRRNPAYDCKRYMNCMILFREFLHRKD